MLWLLNARPFPSMPSDRFSTDDSFVLARLPKAGLGNKLFVWSRALVFARLNALPLVVEGWCTPHWRNWLRCGDLRLYWNYFEPWCEIAPAARRRVESAGNIVYEPALGMLPEKAVPGTVYLFDQQPFWRRCFNGLVEHRDLIRHEFFAHLTAARRAEIDRLPEVPIVAQVRLGDFRRLRQGETLAKVGGARTPLEYFQKLIEEIRSMAGAELPAAVVSDGSLLELKDLTSMPGVTFVSGRSSLADLVLMARSKVLICSAGSTYSLWAAFLGDGVVLQHPDQMHFYCRPREHRRRTFEGAVHPGNPGQWPELMKNNLRLQGPALLPHVVAEPAHEPQRILHVPFSYFPSTCGGTEVYVAALCRELAALGVSNLVVAPDLEDSVGVHEGVPVHRIAVQTTLTLDMLNSRGDVQAARKFGQLLDETHPTIVHFHALSPSVSTQMLREARRRGIATVYTYHTPTGSCHQGTLMRWDKEPCDGRLTATRCAACQLHHLGVPKKVAQTVALTSWATHKLAPCFPGRARWQTPLRAAPLAASRHRSIHEWWLGMDRIVALCTWTEQLLATNGVPRSRVRKVRHGLTQQSGTASAKLPRDLSKPVKLVFLGRLDPTKGLHLLLDALDLVSDLPVQVDVHTIIETTIGSYAQALQTRLKMHAKVRICPPVPSSEVIPTLRSASALLVPSTWFETGPLVVLEAFAAGIPVIGSGFGGIAEWVTDGVNGLLVRDLKPESWARALRRLVEEPGLLDLLTAGVKPPRDMRVVAEEMLSIYEELAAEQGQHAANAMASLRL